MSTHPRRTVAASLFTAGLVVLAMTPAHAQSSLGIGANEATLPPSGMFAGTVMWINAQQQTFYRALTGALRSMREDGSGIWLLTGLSFLYGIFHAAGPGHGKAVISSYMLANEVALRRGVMLSFLSAALQAMTAIVVMGAVFFFLRGTAITMTNATYFLEVASYALVMLFGLYLLWRKAVPRLRNLFGARTAHSLSAAVHHHDHHHDVPHHHHGAQHDRHHAHDHDHAAGEVCATCGHSHAPDPALLSAPKFDWGSAWAAVAAVGIRPCTGALIVLSFAFLNGLWLGGIVAVFAMALGTAITVAALATLAVTAKNVAMTIAGDGRIGNRIHAAIEIGGAAMVFLLGSLLLAASLSAG